MPSDQQSPFKTEAEAREWEMESMRRISRLLDQGMPSLVNGGHAKHKGIAKRGPPSLVRAPPGPTEPYFVFPHERDEYLANCPPNADFSYIVFMPDCDGNTPPREWSYTAPPGITTTFPQELDPEQIEMIKHRFVAKVKAMRSRGASGDGQEDKDGVECEIEERIQNQEIVGSAVIEDEQGAYL